MRRFFWFLIPVLALAIFLAAAYNPRGGVLAAEIYGGPTERILTVAGTGKVRVQPDTAFVNFTVETKNKNLESAQKENAGRIQSLTAALLSLGTPQSDIKTAGFYIFPEYDYGHGFGQKFTGYKVSNHLRVKITDTERIGSIIDAATSTGANIVSGIEFSIEDYGPAYNEALIKAVDSAKEKAAALSKAAGATDTKIISLVEISNRYYSGFEAAGYARSYAADTAHQTSVMRGEIEISAGVELKYEMLFNA